MSRCFKVNSFILIKNKSCEELPRWYVGKIIHKIGINMYAISYNNLITYHFKDEIMRKATELDRIIYA